MAGQGSRGAGANHRLSVFPVSRQRDPTMPDTAAAAALVAPLPADRRVTRALAALEHRASSRPDTPRQPAVQTRFAPRPSPASAGERVEQQQRQTLTVRQRSDAVLDKILRTLQAVDHKLDHHFIPAKLG